MEWETSLTFEDDSTCDLDFAEEDTFQTAMDEVVEVVTSDHSKLTNRDQPDQHPMSAVTGLTLSLDSKLESAGFLSNWEIQQILDS